VSVLRLLLACVALAALAPAAASAQAPQPGEVIAPGMLAYGIDLGGMTVEQAAAVLDGAVRPKLERDVVVTFAGRRRAFRLSARRARFSFDSLRTAKRALYAGRAKVPGSPPVEVPLAIRHGRLPVAAFAESVARGVARRPRDASVRITVRRVFVRQARVGLRLDAPALAAAIDAVLDDPRASRVLRPDRIPVPARVQAADLPRRYGTILTVDRRTFTLRLFKRLRLAKRYSVAVGAAGYDTPAGLFSIASKQVNPAWHAPNRAWAGGLAGQTIPPGDPRNPLKARWLGIVGGVGIHGTSEPWSIGSRASHGCIRMRVPDVIDLYDRVPLGAPVLIR
jgi:hypothetical protein